MRIWFNSHKTYSDTTFLDMPAPSHPRIRITASSSSQLLKFPVMALELTAPKHPHSPHRRWVKSSSFATASTSVITLFLRFPDKGCLSIIHFDFTTLVHHIPPASMEKSKSMADWSIEQHWNSPIHLSFASFMRTTLVVVVSLCVSLTNSLGPVSQQKIKPFTKNLQLEQPRATLGLKGSLPSSGPMLRLNLGKLHNWSCWHHQLQEQYSLLSWQYPEPLVRDTTSDGDPRIFCGKCQIKIANSAISPVTSCWTG